MLVCLCVCMCVCVVCIDIILNSLIIGMHCLPCLGLLVLLVAAALILSEEKVLVAKTNQSRQADKAVRPVCFVLYLLLVLLFPSGLFIN